VPDPSTRRAAPRRAAALLVILALSLTGCTPFEPPEPPEAVTKAAEQSLAEIRAIAGLDEVTMDVSRLDSMVWGPALEEPEQWIVRFAASVPLDDAVAAQGAATALDGELEALRETVPAAAAVVADQRGDAVPVYLDFDSRVAGSVDAADVVAAGSALRSVPEVESVHVSTDPDAARVEIADARHWEDGIAAIRGAPGFGAAGLTAVSVWTDRPTGSTGYATLTLDGTSPSAELVGVMSRVFAMPAVTSLRFDGVRPVAPGTEAEPWRPRLVVGTRTGTGVQPVAALLTGLAEARPAAPRPSYRVTAENGSGEAAGFVGLPPGSPEPHDALPPPTVELPPVDPVAAAAQLERAHALVDELFAEADALAGIAGTPSIETVACADGRGEQLQARTLIPVFQIADFADPAFDAITTAWVDRGYVYADRAMGLDFYAAGTLEQLTIRGTAEGISITVLSDCTA